MSSDAVHSPGSQDAQFPGPNHTSSANGNDQIAHVLFLDVVGFTRIRPVKQQRFVLGKLQDVVRGTDDFRAARKKKQLIALPTGDGMALAFLAGGPGAALSCAEKIAEAVFAHNLTTTEDGAKINVRMGIHTGNVVKISDVNDQTNVAGEGINTAQRVMDCGDAGHILLSDKTFHLLPTEPDRGQQCTSLGIVEVKHGQEVHLYSFYHDGVGNPNLPDKILAKQKEAKEFEEIKTRFQEDERKRRRRLWALAICLFGILVALLALLPWFVKRPDHPPSLAVLALTPQTQGKYSSRAISKGLTEDLMRGFRLLAGSQPPALAREGEDSSDRNYSVQTESEHQLAAIEAGKRLGVRHILTGTVDSALDDGVLSKLSDADPNLGIKLHVELRNTESGALVWEGDYKSTSFNELIAVEEVVIREVSQRLKVTTIQTFEDASRAKAHWCYLVGRFWAFQRTYAQGEIKKDFTQRAMTKYQEAAYLKIPPYYSLALAGLADIHLSTGGVGNDPKEAGKEALAAALEAVKAAYDPKEEAAELYAAIGTEKWWLERDFLGAIIALKMAVTLNPQLADGHKRYSACLAALGKKDEAQKEIKRALELEPASPIFKLTSGQNYVFAEDYDKAIVQFEELILNYPKMYDAAYRFLAIALTERKRGSEALEKLDQVRREKPDSDFLSTQAHIQARLGRTEFATKTVNDLVKLKEQKTGKSITDYVSPYNIAVIYAELPNKEEEALKWLKTATLEFDPRVTWLKVDPRFAKLRASREPEFKARLQEAGLIP